MIFVLLNWPFLGRWVGCYSDNSHAGTQVRELTARVGFLVPFAFQRPRRHSMNEVPSKPVQKVSGFLVAKPRFVKQTWFFSGTVKHSSAC